MYEYQSPMCKPTNMAYCIFFNIYIKKNVLYIFIIKSIAVNLYSTYKVFVLDYNRDMVPGTCKGDCRFWLTGRLQVQVDW